MTRRRTGCCFTFAATLALAGAPETASAQIPESGPSPHGLVSAVRTAVPPSIDGRLVAECWDLAGPVAGLVKVDPDRGQPATEQTEIRVAYDNDALYVAARMLDSDASHLSRRLSKRD